MKKNNTWNIRRLVGESFVPVTQRIILKIDGFLLSNLYTVAEELPGPPSFWENWQLSPMTATWKLANIATHTCVGQLAHQK